MILLMALLRVTISSTHWFWRSITPRAATSLLGRMRGISASGIYKNLSPSCFWHPLLFHASYNFVFSSTFYSVQSELSAPCKKLDEWLAAVPLLHHIPLLKH
jgi:hypothetical protein